MATFNKYQDFVEQLGLETHNLSTDELKLALFTVTHTPAATDTAYSALTNEVANGNGYTTGGNILTKTWAETGGTATLDATDTSWTGATAGFSYRYAVLYNNTPAGKNLIAYFDEGSSVTIAVGETRTLQFNASGILTLA